MRSRAWMVLGVVLLLSADTSGKDKEKEDTTRHYPCRPCSALPEPATVKPACSLPPVSKDREVRVVILARYDFFEEVYLGGKWPPSSEERDLSYLFRKQLEKEFSNQPVRYAIVPIKKVEQYKEEHPRWHHEDVLDIGKHFEADYTITLKIRSLKLLRTSDEEKRLQRQISIFLSVVDMNRPEEDPIYEEEYVSPTVVKDEPIRKCDYWRRDRIFLDQVAGELADRFIAHSGATAAVSVIWE
jgi:hypothetical protein